VILRKERLTLERRPPRGVNELPARIEFVNYLGSTIQYLCSVGLRTALVSRRNEAGGPELGVGQNVTLTFRPEDCFCLRAQ